MARSAQNGLRLMIYDAEAGKSGTPFLPFVWRTGGGLYRLLGRFDAYQGFGTWFAALEWLVEVGAPAPIAEIQFWGHGKWGYAVMGTQHFNQRCFTDSDWQGRLRAVAARLIHRDSLGDAMSDPALDATTPIGWWFRSCETFGANAGQRFARDCADFFGCRVAGHTHEIGYYQSGLHSLAPGEDPYWESDEGIAEGTPQDPRSSVKSRRKRPNTVSCFDGQVPDGW
jgi:hypothetical protein